MTVARSVIGTVTNRGVRLESLIVDLGSAHLTGPVAALVEPLEGALDTIQFSLHPLEVPAHRLSVHGDNGTG